MRVLTLTTGMVLLLVAALLAVPALAFAYDEPHGMPEFVDGSPNHGQTSTSLECNVCHRADLIDPSGNEDCLVCHGDIVPPPQPEVGQGPHGSYSSVSNRCNACHTVHKAPAGGILLLQSSTLTGSCYSCHDGTGGHGVYGAIAAQGLVANGLHRVDTTNTVPGGDRLTGGDATMTGSGVNSTLGCDDCHSPHNASTVASFTNERKRTSLDYIEDPSKGRMTNRLLKQRPGDATQAVSVYGSDWCLGCHGGRASGGAVHNHPADSKVTTSTPFDFMHVAELASESATGNTVIGSMGRTNRGYLMPYPRTAQQAGHAPICEQCHGDGRTVGSLNATGTIGTPTPWSVTSTDGLNPLDSPRFQNFPHETTDTNMLVESGDGLCLNCHPPAVLP